MSKLHLLTPNITESSIVDVIFVHGLNGHFQDTWNYKRLKKFYKEDRFWANSSIAFWSLSYEAKPSNWMGNTMPLSDRAINVLATLKGQEIGSKPIIFIVHSLGGLLVKQMLRSARDLAREYKDIVSNTVGIIFFATPHSGSNLANYTKYLEIILKRTVSVQELERNTPVLLEINKWFRNNVEEMSIEILVFYETQKTQLINGKFFGIVGKMKPILVVESSSADPGINGVTPIPIDADHINICKPEDTDSTAYTNTKIFIQKILQTIQSPHLNQSTSLINKSWLVIQQEMKIPISSLNENELVNTLRPDLLCENPIKISLPANQLPPWTGLAKIQEYPISQAIEKVKHTSASGFAVFSMAQIPLAIHLGFMLSDRFPVRYSQYDRDRGSWDWQQIDSSEIDTNIMMSGFPQESIKEEVEILIRVSLSAAITKDQTNRSISKVPVEIDIYVENPDVRWLKSPKQLMKLSKIFEEALSKVRTHIPKCSKIHLFCAIPTGACIAIGRAINPNMNPPVELYEFARNNNPPYQWALTLKDRNS
ncbi:MAG: SAVED domain-containing protein [Xenococcus sp. (in: cyanobacteria)]